MLPNDVNDIMEFDRLEHATIDVHKISWIHIKIAVRVKLLRVTRELFVFNSMHMVSLTVNVRTKQYNLLTRAQVSSLKFQRKEKQKKTNFENAKEMLNKIANHFHQILLRTVPFHLYRIAVIVALLCGLNSVRLSFSHSLSFPPFRLFFSSTILQI